jgi:predicted methyltransferase
MPRTSSSGLAAALAASLLACGSAHPAASAVRGADPVALVADPGRTEADRALDAGRRPAGMLAFLDVRPLMRVADLGAGGGYTTELLARAVGPAGVVYGQNSKALLGFVGEAWAARLERPVNRNVVRVDREFDSPLPPEAVGLDLVVMNAVYHDTVAMKTDRAALNRAVFAALRPGGAYVVIDSSARPGRGELDAPTLHRIEEELVKKEVVAAGFRLAAEGSFLRHPEDARDWNTSPRAAGERRGTGDRFALRFVKP